MAKQHAVLLEELKAADESSSDGEGAANVEMSNMSIMQPQISADAQMIEDAQLEK